MLIRKKEFNNSVGINKFFMAEKKFSLKGIIKKIETSKIMAAIIFNLFFFLLILLFCDMKYEVSDDFVMATILSGAYGDTQNPQMIFVNVLIGYFLIPFYKLFPSVSWYFVAQVLFVFVASTTVTYLLLERLDKTRAILLSVLFVLFFVNDAYVLLQFTKTAMLGVMAGSLLFIWALFERQSVLKILYGAALCLVGSMIRFSTIYIAGGFILFILLCEFLDMFRKREWNHQVLTIVFSGILLICCAYGMQKLNWYTYNNDEAYGGFSAYNSARAAIVDLGESDYSIYAEELAAIGGSENDFYMMKSWCFADNEVFSLEKMEQVAEILKNKRENQSVDFEVVLERLQNREYGKYPAFLACIILFCIGIFLNYNKWWTMLVCSSIGIGYLTYFAYIGRCVYRVEYAVFLGLFLSGSYFWTKSLQDKDILVEKEKAKRICIIITMICIIGNLIFYVPDTTYKEVTSENRMYYINDTFYRSWDYDAQKYRKVVNKGKPTSRLLEEFEDNKNNFYFLDFNTTIQTLYFEWKPWRSLGVGEYDNYLYFAGVTSAFPDVVRLLESKNLENSLKSLVREDVYMVDNYNVEMKLNYLREHYYPEARVELYKEIDGYQIWKYYEK